MAHALRYLVRSVVERVAPNALEPVGGNRFHLRSAFALFAFVSAAFAQTSRTSEQPLRFAVFSSKPIANFSFAPRAAAAPQKIVFYPTARSPRYEFRGAMPLRFVDSATNSVVAEATIPPEIRDALLLFTAIAPVPADSTGSRQASGLRYQVAVLDDGVARHAAGGLAIINLSGLALAGTVGNQAVTLTAGLNPTLTVGRAAKIAFRTTLKNRSYQSYADTLQRSGKERALLILFPPFYKGSFEVQSRLLVDEPPAPAVNR